MLTDMLIANRYGMLLNYLSGKQTFNLLYVQQLPTNQESPCQLGKGAF